MDNLESMQIKRRSELPNARSEDQVKCKELASSYLMPPSRVNQLDLPQMFPNVEEELKKYIACPKLPINDFEASQQHWKRTPNCSNLINFDLSDVPTTIRVMRDHTTGQSLGLTEVNKDGQSVSGHKISLSEIPRLLEEALNFDLILENEFLKKPSALLRGYDFSKLDASSTLPNEDVNVHSGQTDSNEEHIIDIAQLLKEQKPLVEEDETVEAEKPISVAPTVLVNDSNIEEIIETLTKDTPLRPPVLKISETNFSRVVKRTEWAELIDISHPVLDFHQRIPNMAFKYPFELDTFQKQAILKLEERCNVLVSAHTSAGKTVVAEYAIALSQRHMTRAIYTSPIKALSNQKYRDFRHTFHDVGLITGDFQVNATGTCLVMTTEILRSMLLAHNDVIRDLEFVIFDEVHYINDLDRGHVWEEVVILLPPHVSIVMLSATVPNALEFADWVGRTKQRRMYVVSTLQRPVPLKHYLYTGSGGSTRDERFLILEKDTFIRQGFMAAVAAKQKRGKAKDGPRDGRHRLGPKQESTLWVALLQHLLSRDELPVVAFTLSRKRCDQNADALSLDLTTGQEKAHIRHFFHQCIQRLNQSDRDLPQILNMGRLLENGIGVHHSGILPILKEIVELLFQERYVKVLFATETFAMGVNMPAKTVVFDSIIKYDGSSTRTLLPSEYIQMAGRAGRRGLDENGNVLIVCKNDLLNEQDFLSMMMGQPKKIQSQFRLTYSIILKLERKRIAAEGRVSVEEMMANSFMETDHIKAKQAHQSALESVEKALADADVAIERSASWQSLQQVSKLGLEFLDLWYTLSQKVMTSKFGQKLLTPGRILLIAHGKHVNKLGVLLSVENKKEIKFTVLVLDEKGEESAETISGFHKVLALTSTRVFVPSTLGGHQVLTISAYDVLEIVNITIKLDPKIVINDWENRQIPRFKGNPPGQTFQRVLEELVAITHKSQISGDLETLPLLKDIAVTSEDELIQIKKLSEIKKTLQKTNRDDVLDWEQQLEQVFRFSALKKEKENLMYLLSYESMHLYADYQNRLTVLREMGYVDARNSVQMKGNVACEMSSHELLITELVLRNTLNHLQPAEIAALLSCFVYQGNDTGEPLNVSSTLAKAIQDIQAVESEVFLMEQRCNVIDGFGPQKGLCFELVPIVYEWATNKPFSQIMALTDTQEGIIVRCIQQLNETIRDVRDAARIIGEPTLQQKMEEASNAIKRDIVFAASLYMQ